MLGTVERPHAGIGLVPDAQVLEFAVDLAACCEHFGHVPPIHADLVDRAIDTVGGQESEYRLKEGHELSFAHFSAPHGKVAMANAAESADVAVDRHIVWRVGEYEFCLPAFKEHIVGCLVPGVAAKQAVTS